MQLGMNVPQDVVSPDGIDEALVCFQFADAQDEAILPQCSRCLFKCHGGTNDEELAGIPEHPAAFRLDIAECDDMRCAAQKPAIEAAQPGTLHVRTRTRTGDKASLEAAQGDETKSRSTP